MAGVFLCLSGQVPDASVMETGALRFSSAPDMFHRTDGGTAMVSGFFDILTETGVSV
jgi:hypothetical protein